MFSPLLNRPIYTGKKNVWVNASFLFVSTIYTEKCVCQGCDFPFKIYILKNVLNTMIFLSKLYIEKMYVGLGVRAANFLFIWHSPYNLSHTLIIHHFYIDYFDWNRCTIQVLGNHEL